MKRVFFTCLAILISNFAFSQEALKSTEEEYYDFLALQGLTERPTLNYRTLSDSEWHFNQDEEGNSLFDSEKNVWKENNLGKKLTIYESNSTTENFFTKGIDKNIKFKLYGPEWFNSYNTEAPYGQNDGGLWQGKGYNTSLTGGARVEGYGFEATFKPQISFSKNEEFEYLPGVYGDTHSYFWTGNIDLVQRFGDKSFWNYDWGDTEFRYTWYNLTAGFGWQSPWLGPAWLNPMLGSNNAPTYPKIDAGLRKTKLEFFGIDFGSIEGRIWLGKLTESKYFDKDETNNNNLLTGFSVAYAPSLFDGLTLSINKICISKWNDKSLKYLNPFYSKNDLEDQKASFGFDWIFPQVSFEIFGELGIDDYSAKQIENPFHTAIYTVGLKKIISPLKKYGIYNELIVEWNNFEMSQDFQLQWQYMGYYSHSIISQGYTNKGQILGAGSGYFGNSQFFGLRTYFPKGNFTLFLQYDRPDMNYIHNKAVVTKSDDWKDNTTKQSDDWANFKAIRTYGIDIKYFLTDSLLLKANASSSWIVKNNYKTDDESKRNFHIELGAKYNF